MSIVYLNGDFMPIEQAKISVLDRGFLFGDGVYEVVPIFNQTLFRFKEHVDRLNKSLTSIKIDLHIDEDTWRNIITELIQKNPKSGAIYWQLTRGVDDIRRHIFPKPLNPSIFLMPLAEKKQSLLEHPGIGLVTQDDSRWAYSHIKSTSLLANVLAAQEAYEQDAQEMLLLRDGVLVEGSSSNVFVVKNDTIFTPPVQPCMLQGVTRDCVLELADQHQFNYQESNISAEQLQNADEIWITSSTREILPAISLDQKPIGSGKPGPIWKKMVDAYLQYKNNYSE